MSSLNIYLCMSILMSLWQNRSVPRPWGDIWRVSAVPPSRLAPALRPCDVLQRAVGADRQAEEHPADEQQGPEEPEEEGVGEDRRGQGGQAGARVVCAAQTSGDGAGGVTVVGPLLTGLDKPVQIASMSATASDMVNLAVIAAYDIHR